MLRCVAVRINIVVVFSGDRSNRYISFIIELTGEYLHLVCDSSETRNELVVSIKQASLIQSQGLNRGNKVYGVY